MANQVLAELQKEVAEIINDRNGSNIDRLLDIFTSFSGFEYGVARVEYKKKYNFINKKGEFVSPVWFDWMDIPNKDYTAVCLNDKFNYIDLEGKLLSPFQWFDESYSFNGQPETIVFIDGNEYTIDRYGNVK